MKARVDGLVETLNAEPAVVILPEEDQNEQQQQQQQQQHVSTSIITGSSLLSAFRRPVYAPAKEFVSLARALADAVDSANYTLVLRAQFQWHQPPTLDDVFCHGGRSPSSPGEGGGNNNNNRSAVLATRSEPDAARAILCGDGGDATARLGPDGLQRYVEELRGQSPTLGPYWATIRFECAGWKVRPGWRFTGPFGTPPPLGIERHSDTTTTRMTLNPDDDLAEEEEEEDSQQRKKRDGSSGGGRPSAPLLFVTARLDPVTPLRNAHAMAASHPGAVVLEVDAVGHCGSTVPSRCSREVIRDYLEFGRVDLGNGSSNNNTIRCAAEFDPWGPPAEGEQGVEQDVVEVEGMRRRGGKRTRTRTRSGPVDLLAAWPVF